MKACSSAGGLNYDVSKRIFIIALEDYFSGKINTNFLASVATNLYYELNSPKDFYNSPQAQKLGNALMDASEIDYYEQCKDRSKVDYKNYEKMRQALREFLAEYSG